MGQVMMGGLKRCHFLLKNWDLNLFRGGHIDLLVRFRSRFFGMGSDWWVDRENKCYWDSWR